MLHPGAASQGLPGGPGNPGLKGERGFSYPGAPGFPGQKGARGEQGETFNKSFIILVPKNAETLSCCLMSQTLKVYIIIPAGMSFFVFQVRLAVQGSLVHLDFLVRMGSQIFLDLWEILATLGWMEIMVNTFPQSSYLYFFSLKAVLDLFLSLTFLMLALFILVIFFFSPLF